MVFWGFIQAENPVHGNDDSFPRVGDMTAPAGRWTAGTVQAVFARPFSSDPQRSPARSAPRHPVSGAPPLPRGAWMAQPAAQAWPPPPITAQMAEASAWLPVRILTLKPPSSFCRNVTPHPYAFNLAGYGRQPFHIVFHRAAAPSFRCR